MPDRPLLDVNAPFPDNCIIVGVSLDRIDRDHTMKYALCEHLDSDQPEPIAMRPNYASGVFEFAFHDENSAFDFKIRWG